MNKKGFELAISTIILIIIGVLVLIALILAVKGIFENLSDTTDPFANTAEASAVREACNLACSAENKLVYCCNDFEIQDNKIRCDDPRLDIECSTSCAEVSCLGE